MPPVDGLLPVRPSQSAYVLTATSRVVSGRSADIWSHTKREPDHPHVLGQDEGELTRPFYAFIYQTNASAPNVPGDIDLGPPAHADLDPLANNDLHDMPPPLEHVQILDDLWRILRNPHAMLDQWGDYVEPDASEADDRSIREGSVSSNKDPAFEERMDEPELDPNNPNDEPYIDIDVLRNFLNEHLAELDDDKWEELQARELNPGDRKLLELLATRLRTCFSRSTWNDLRLGVCADYNIPSEFIAWRRLRILAGLDTKTYHCCINSCVCYIGRFDDLQACPFCRERRLNANRKPRRVFHYTPLIPQLRALYQDAAMAAKLRYRDEADQGPEPGVIHDVFDGQDYRRLRATPVNPPGGYHFFDNPEDLALGLSTDGVTLFKRHRRGLSTAWPIILINYNLHPRYRTKLDNIICVGVIPGPTQCKDINSFLTPLLNELLELEAGDTMDAPPAKPVTCRVILAPLRGPPSITSLRRPTTQSHSPFELPMRSHAEFLGDLEVIEAAPTRVAREFLQKDLVADQGNGSYEIDEVVWKAVGRQTAAATKTIPAEFVGTIPNIAEDAKLFKAEAYAFWFQYMAPILLQGRLNEPYYSHFLKMREIMLLVLKFGISNDEIDELERMTGEWVLEYESLYYQYTVERLPACPLTIHALLHMAYYIRQTGPLWASWAFVMERYCQFIVLAVKNRVRPYEMIDNYVSRDSDEDCVENLQFTADGKTACKYEDGTRRRDIEPREDARRVSRSRARNARKDTGCTNGSAGKPASRLFLSRRTRTPRTNSDGGPISIRSISYGRFARFQMGSRRTARLISIMPSHAKLICQGNMTSCLIAMLAGDASQMIHIGAATTLVKSDGNVKAYLLAAVRELGQTWAIVDRSRDNVRPQFDDDHDEDEDKDGDE
ncbi:Transposase family tnp2 [Rhizoctonia solani]|uniref:Transposase family tnp2 n=1 Tax=Rhizoctonia solani TaxID=456999 RepID=A0A8H7IAP4_9AGAM|nr:Transposase family tnp2 [Rhizoctonia solani]